MKQAIKIYIHADREGVWKLGESLGLTGEALRLFSFTGYEHEMTYTFDKTGESELVEVDGRKLEDVSD